MPKSGVLKRNNQPIPLFSFECRRGIYTSNLVVAVSRPLVCYGGLGVGNAQPECEYLGDCKRVHKKFLSALEPADELGEEEEEDLP